MGSNCVFASLTVTVCMHIDVFCGKNSNYGQITLQLAEVYLR